MKLMSEFEIEIEKLKSEYGSELAMLNGFAKENLDFTSFIDNFVDGDNVADNTIDPNANSDNRDMPTLERDMVKPHKKLLSFNKLFYEMTKKYGIEEARKWLRMEYTGALLLHDAVDASFKSYCYSYDLKDLVNKGLFFMDKNFTDPPKHLDSFNRFVLNFISYTSNRTNGAVGLPSYLVHSFYFWNKDVKEGRYLLSPEYYRDQNFQSFIYDLNEPYLRVAESAFTNINIFDRKYLEGMFGDVIYPDGTLAIDYIEEIMEYQKAFMDVVADIRKRTMFTFPVLTYSMLFQEGNFKDEEFARWANKHNMKWYDSNFYIGNSIDSCSACCRFVPNIEDINNHKKDMEEKGLFINSIGGSALNVGSVRVNDLNLFHIANLSDDYIDFKNKIRDYTFTNLKILDVIRNTIKRNVEKGILNIYKHGLVDFNSQYNTVGIASFYECIDYYGGIDTDQFGNKKYTKFGESIAEEILNIIKESIEEFRKLEEVDYLVNIEQSPNESGAVRMASKDAIILGTNYSIYGNQWIPLQEKCLLNDKIEISAKLDRMCSGGAISHINIESGFTNEEQSWKMLCELANKGLIYFAYNRAISVCKDNHSFYGDICTTCGNPKVDEYMRVVGFLTPVSSYSKERKIEYDKRQWFKVE